MDVIALVYDLKVRVDAAQLRCIFRHTNAARRHAVTSHRATLRIAAGVKAVRHSANTGIAHRVAVSAGHLLAVNTPETRRWRSHQRLPEQCNLGAIRYNHRRRAHR